VISVILTILKIIGIVLAVLVGLVLLLVLLVGFVPIRYRAEGEYPYEGTLNEEVISRRKRDELMQKVKVSDGINEDDSKSENKTLKIRASAAVSWLLHIVHVSFDMDDTGAVLKVKLFGLFTLYSNDPETIRKKEEKARKKEEKRREKERKEALKNGGKGRAEAEADKDSEDEPENDTGLLKTEKEANEEDTKEAGAEKEDNRTDIVNAGSDKDSDNSDREASKSDTESETPEKEDKDKSEKEASEKKEKEKGQKKEQKKEDKSEKEGEGKLDRLKGKFLKLKKKLDYIKGMIEDTRVRRGISYAKKKLFLIIKRVLPKKLNGRVAFGLDDPGTTGQITGMVSLFYGLWGGHFVLEPDFENKKLEADVSLKGRIIIAMLVIPALKVWFNKDIKFIRKKVGKLKNM